MAIRFQTQFEPDIWELAALLLEKHSELAANIVLELAVANLNAGDYDRSAMWALVGSAIDELQKCEGGFKPERAGQLSGA